MFPVKRCMNLSFLNLNRQPYTSDDDFEDFKKLEYGRTKSNGNRKAIDKYKYLQYQIQDKQGQSYTIKKKIKYFS